ncbi:zinc finger C3HC-type protein 1-like [Ornithodoros turicata]|uniref:zinc finger C3HC-type protein 1-like n=1 Tax=Ornithodoros turicata TaxID=34597 RepID=UPI003139C0CD
MSTVIASASPAKNTNEDISCLQLSDSTLATASPADDRNFQEFKHRISTFSDNFGTLSKWFCKPLELSPPECAKFGWTCSSADMLVCSSCKKYLHCKISASLSNQLRTRHVKELVRSLKEAHVKHCPWKVAPCPESYTIMPQLLRKDALSQFRGRFETLLRLSDKLPAPEMQNVEKQIVPEYVTELITLCHAEDNAISRSAAVLAILGWKAGLVCPTRKYIACDFCQRSTGTWFYLSVTESKCVDKNAGMCGGDTADSPVCTQKDTIVDGKDADKEKVCGGVKRKHDGEEKFNPLSEHFAWCIWRRANASNKQGWEVFLESLLHNIASSKSSGDSLPVGDVYVQVHKILAVLAQ